MIKKITTDNKIDELARMVAKGFASTTEDINKVRGDLNEVKEDLSGVKQDLNGVKQDLSGVKQDVNEIKKDIREINMKLYDIDEYTRRNSRRIEKLEEKASIL